jgi:hypothetical protein
VHSNNNNNWQFLYFITPNKEVQKNSLKEREDGKQKILIITPITIIRFNLIEYMLPTLHAKNN